MSVSSHTTYRDTYNDPSLSTYIKSCKKPTYTIKYHYDKLISTSHAIHKELIVVPMNKTFDENKYKRVNNIINNNHNNIYNTSNNVYQPHLNTKINSKSIKFPTRTSYKLDAHSTYNETYINHKNINNDKRTKKKNDTSSQLGEYFSFSIKYA